MITVTPKAAEKLKQKIDALFPQTKTAGIRFAVRAGGCSGFIYEVLKPESGPEKFDKVFESNGINIFVNPKSLVIVDGTEIDHSDNLLEGFVFKNPNTKTSCGCGVSFEKK